MDLTSLTSSIINIPLSKHVHNHSIGCTAINSIGTTNTSIRLLIRCRNFSFFLFFISYFLDPPIFIVRPPKFVVLDFDSKSLVSNPMILRCIVDSYPRARISWYRYGERLIEGSLFNLENITKREQQGIYSYRIETDGYETIQNEFIIYIKGIEFFKKQRFLGNFSLLGKPLIYIEESKENNRLFQCQVYSSSPILVC
jgi:hypothetical protein